MSSSGSDIYPRSAAGPTSRYETGTDSASITPPVTVCCSGRALATHANINTTSLLTSWKRSLPRANLVLTYSNFMIFSLARKRILCEKASLAQFSIEIGDLTFRTSR